MSECKRVSIKMYFAYLSLSAFFVSLCLFFIPISNRLSNIQSYIITSFVEFLLVALIFIGIPNKILAEHFFQKKILDIFEKYSNMYGSTIKPNIKKYESINLLIYWADVIAILFALRLLQLAEYSSINKLTVTLNIVWFIILILYWYYIVRKIAGEGYRLNPINEEELHLAVDGGFEKLSNKLFIGDCILWILFTAIPGPPSEGLVISLFLFTAVSLIDEYTDVDDPVVSLKNDWWRSAPLIIGGSFCFWLQWGENELLSINKIWSYLTEDNFLKINKLISITYKTLPDHGFFYPLLVYAIIVVIAIWRGGERHHVQKKNANERKIALDNKREILKNYLHNISKVADIANKQSARLFKIQDRIRTINLDSVNSNNDYILYELKKDASILNILGAGVRSAFAMSETESEIREPLALGRSNSINFIDSIAGGLTNLKSLIETVICFEMMDTNSPGKEFLSNAIFNVDYVENEDIEENFSSTFLPKIKTYVNKVITDESSILFSKLGYVAVSSGVRTDKIMRSFYWGLLGCLVELLRNVFEHSNAKGAETLQVGCKIDNQGKFLIYVALKFPRQSTKGSVGTGQLACAQFSELFDIEYVSSFSENNVSVEAASCLADKLFETNDYCISAFIVNII